MLVGRDDLHIIQGCHLRVNDIYILLEIFLSVLFFQTYKGVMFNTSAWSCYPPKFGKPSIIIICITELNILLVKRYEKVLYGHISDVPSVSLYNTFTNLFLPRRFSLKHIILRKKVLPKEKNKPQINVVSLKRCNNLEVMEYQIRNVFYCVR